MGRSDSKVAKKDDSDTKDFKARSARERISLDDFVHRKGQVRALEEFKYRKQRKKVQTAKALRSYRKVMKQEGYEAGQGASRKRMEVSSRHEEDDSDHSNIEDVEDNVATKTHKRRHKMNPFQKSVQKAEQKMVTAKQHAQQKKQNEKQRLQKLKERKQRTKLLNKRTKRGQPIMKHVVDNLLHKLEKQKNES
mmetsp:Transcript_16013/g.39218  ORF Transcript_16013/g.39218 Transcript_16013/m.39218 type:complete len:193 (-) Transcript_16013:340-918(-)|eukprot:CAMPEP_0113630756 /NCGR_PEP_ID=MMETSP0017_2-20120614/15982_1 /TAXON_ID=2856 /ORGANISM="Cylindrotheca closterium" /LENGTH=192 /DNA_ID=CAMNT_0000541237 /DNA_START=25 /DNA_END=603 /DNA_ORIENTATION=+ /assembly_acc=CAM_ASM_000147